jgi:hypothetical protein
VSNEPDSNLRSSTRLIAGIDEAGLGPLLGPLTMAWAVFRTPVDAGDDLWKPLQSVVSGDPKQDGDKLIVADSKRVYTRNDRGRKRLENTVLCFLAQLEAERRVPRHSRDVLFGGPLAPNPETIAEHLWYEKLTELPLSGEAGAVELRAERLHRAMKQAGIELVSYGVRVVPSGELNQAFIATGNKGATVWQLLHRIMRHLWDNHAEGGLRAVIDRQGGRWKYGPHLGRSFPDATVKLVTEAPAYSEYDVTGRASEGVGGRGLRLAFAEKAEDHSFAVALASCLAKYTRELAMRAFNEYFEELQPGLKPTAGYVQDGRRWVLEAQNALAASGLKRAVVERTR